MNQTDQIRADFEAEYPSNFAMWSKESDCYVMKPGTWSSQEAIDIFNARWQGYQSGRAAVQGEAVEDADKPYQVTLDRRDLFDFVRAAITDALETDETRNQPLSGVRSDAHIRTERCLSELYELTPAGKHAQPRCGYCDATGEWRVSCDCTANTAQPDQWDAAIEAAAEVIFTRKGGEGSWHWDFDAILALRKGA